MIPLSDTLKIEVQELLSSAVDDAFCAMDRGDYGTAGFEDREIELCESLYKLSASISVESKFCGGDGFITPRSYKDKIYLDDIRLSLFDLESDTYILIDTEPIKVLYD